MSNRIENAHRRLLPITVLAYLLAAAAAQRTGEASTGKAASSHGVQVAGVHLSLGFHGHYGHYHRHYRPYRYYRGYYPYRHFYPHVYYHGAYGVPRYASRYFGGLDLNVKPKKTTQVYIDGNYVGLTGHFDGWPEYLWLEKDTYELILYSPGYRTVVRQVEIQPGVVIKIREDMQPGESVPPEELTAARPAPRPPARRYGAAPTPAPTPREPAAPAPRVESTPEAGVLDARQQPARLKLSVAPADASVYLDGHFLGLAGEIGEQRSGILVDPGEHRLEIVRPGYAGRELRFDAEPGGEVELEVELTAGSAAARLSA